MTSQVSFNQAIYQALSELLQKDQKILLMGLGVSDPKGFFGTTTGFVDQFGPDRIIECPTSENAYLGHALGLSLSGFKPIVHFQRMDFMLYAYDQLINNIAKWRDMFSLNRNLPLVIRTLVGMGWGQGAQHSQNLSALLAQVPGLKVVAPSCPESAAGLLKSAIHQNDPVVFVEHRWLQGLKQTLPAKASFDWKIGSSVIRKQGQGCTIVTWSYGVAEALRFAELFPDFDCEVIDLLSLNPLDVSEVKTSVQKTGNLIVWEPSYEFLGIGSEIISQLVEGGWSGKVLRLGYPQAYPSASPLEVYNHYLSLEKIREQINQKFGFKLPVVDQKVWPRDKDLSHWSPWATL